jgi:hypothetical protein
LWQDLLPTVLWVTESGTRLQIVLIVASMASFVATIAIGHSIAEDVNEKLGTEYKGVFGKGDPWTEHLRLFPASRKRVALALALIGFFGFGVLCAAVT